MEVKLKALMYTGIGQLEIQDVPMPTDDFIVKVSGCGVCGTDLKTYLQGHHFFSPPTVLGHEFYGSVFKAPEDCGFNTGDIVVVAPYCECGSCGICLRSVGQLCRDKAFIQSGAFCEYVGIPLDYLKKGVFKIERNDDVFTLVEPLACVINGVEHLKITPYSKILVVGSGPIGALFALLFKDRRIPVAVVEPTRKRRELIAAWDIECYVPGQVEAGMFDNIVIAVNKAELVNEYITEIADGGTVLLFSGLPKDMLLSIDSYSVHYREVSFVGSFGYAMKHFVDALDIIKSHPDKYSKVITHRLPLEQGKESFELLKKSEHLKLILKP